MQRPLYASLTSLAQRKALLQLVSVALTMVAAVLAVTGVVLRNGDLLGWVGVAVLLSQVPAMVLNHTLTCTELEATNKALERCHGLIIWWDSLPLVRRQSHAVKERLCEMLEGAAMAVSSASTGSSSELSKERGDEEPEED